MNKNNIKKFINYYIQDKGRIFAFFFLILFAIATGIVCWGEVIMILPLSVSLGALALIIIDTYLTMKKQEEND